MANRMVIAPVPGPLALATVLVPRHSGLTIKLAALSVQFPLPSGCPKFGATAGKPGERRGRERRGKRNDFQQIRAKSASLLGFRFWWSSSSSPVHPAEPLRRNPEGFWLFRGRRSPSGIAPSELFSLAGSK